LRGGLQAPPRLPRDGCGISRGGGKYSDRPWPPADFDDAAIDRLERSVCATTLNLMGVTTDGRRSSSRAGSWRAAVRVGFVARYSIENVSYSAGCDASRSRPAVCSSLRIPVLAGVDRSTPALPTQEVLMSRTSARTARLAVGCLALSGAIVSAQTAVPIAGTTGTIATEGSMKAFYRGAKTIVVTTVDGVDHVYEFTKDLIVHGGKHPGPDALANLREGTTVVVHYTLAGDEAAAREIDVVGDGVRVTEGIVTKLDRRHHRLTVRYDNGRTDTFQLSDRASGEASGDVGARVQIYYIDEQGRRIVHFFKSLS
jgi:hypothetical protein